MLLRKPFLCWILLAGAALALEADLAAQLVAWAKANYGAVAAERVQRWQSLSTAGVGWTELDKLRSVNSFFNEVPSVTDLQHWRRQDYWATPLELLVSNGGDCEDFAIAKYFTLRELGVPDERLKIAYVKAQLAPGGQSIAHMVLTYYPTPEAEPLILDNLVAAIKPARERADLTPLYSFNARGLWAAKERVLGKWLGPAEDINLWKDLMKRMQQVPEPR